MVGGGGGGGGGGHVRFRVSRFSLSVRCPCEVIYTDNYSCLQLVALE